jgi:hypothetical protein
VDIQSINDAMVENFINKVARDLQPSIESDDVELPNATTPDTNVEGDDVELPNAMTPDPNVESDDVELPNATTINDPYAVLQDSKPLSALCPQCFGGDPRAEIGYVSVDGNFQQKRLPTKTGEDNRYLELRDKRLFIDDGTALGKVCIHFLRCSDARKDEAKDDTITTCSSNFVAAQETAASKSKVADAGLMAVVCRCGSPLRLHNIRQTGERGIYAVRLLQSLLKDPSCPPKLILSYDINCQFSKYVKVEVPSCCF